MADSLVKAEKLGCRPTKRGAACVWLGVWVEALIEKRKPLNKQFHPIYEHNSPCQRLEYGKTEILS